MYFVYSIVEKKACSIFNISLNGIDPYIMVNSDIQTIHISVNLLNTILNFWVFKHEFIKREMKCYGA